MAFLKHGKKLLDHYYPVMILIQPLKKHALNIIPGLSQYYHVIISIILDIS
jgi:hypothetical protein